MYGDFLDTEGGRVHHLVKVEGDVRGIQVHVKCKQSWTGCVWNEGGHLECFTLGQGTSTIVGNVAGYSGSIEKVGSVFRRPSSLAQLDEVNGAVVKTELHQDIAENSSHLRSEGNVIAGHPHPGASQG